MTNIEALNEVNKRLSSMKTVTAEWNVNERAYIYKTIDFLETVKKALKQVLDLENIK